MGQGSISTGGTKATVPVPVPGQYCGTGTGTGTGKCREITRVSMRNVRKKGHKISLVMPKIKIRLFPLTLGFWGAGGAQ